MITVKTASLLLPISLALILVSCKSADVQNHAVHVNDQLMVNTDNPSQPTSPITDVYDVESVAKKVAQGESLKSGSLGKAFPSKEQMVEILDLYESGGLLFFFSAGYGGDGGWALWQNGRIVKIWITTYGGL